MRLPIHEVAGRLVASLRDHRRLVLTAPTGSGKSTQTPQILHHAREDARIDGQIVVLQPRRLATRLVAQRVAHEMGSNVGDLVGYQTRLESRISKATQIRFMTEGLLLRLLQADPTLPGIGAVLLDEFHERSLQADTALALLRQAQATQRPDLAFMLMSATLDAARLADALDCPTVQTEGRLYPVDIRHLDKASDKRVWDLATTAVADALQMHNGGHVLVFMPGVYEINRTIGSCRERLKGLATGDGVEVLPLYSALPPAQQDKAVSQSQHRKVIVATNVAETSITIEGIVHVVDSGLARMEHFDPRRGINVLGVEPISQASADQRAGRAGRTGPGVCTRLWIEREHKHRAAQTPPEIQRLDLAQTLLQVRSMGYDMAQLPWVEPPSSERLTQARDLLRELDAIDENDRLTKTGIGMAALPMHPRLARMLLEAQRRGCIDRAVVWAAIVSEPDMLARDERSLRRWLRDDEWPDTEDDQQPPVMSDFVAIERALDAARHANFAPGRCSDLGIRAESARQVDQTADLYRKALPKGDRLAADGSAAGGSALEQLIRCVLVAFPDHVAKRHSAQTLACGLTRKRRGELDRSSLAAQGDLWVAIDIRELARKGAATTLLSLASTIRRDWLEELFPSRLRDAREAVWDEEHRRVAQVHRVWFEELLIEQTTVGQPDAEAASAVLAARIISGDLKLKKWDDELEQWIERTRCVADWFPDRDLLTYSDDDLRVLLDELCTGCDRARQVEDKPVDQLLRHAMSWDDQQFIERMAPTKIPLPKAKRPTSISLTYKQGEAPRGQAKVQDLFDFEGHPTVAHGKVAILLEILAPNYRPVQVTDDLPGFWERTYPQVKKDLSRRYSKHEWR